MEQKLNIEVTGNELTIREGKALDLKPKEKVSLSGTITAPGDYALTYVLYLKSTSWKTFFITIIFILTWAN